MAMQPRQQPFQGWIASLSNGDTVWETPPVPGEKSSWQKLIDRLGRENLKVTGLRVQRGGVTVCALPPKQCDGYYQAYELRKIMFRGQSQHRQACGSVVNDQVFIFWIDEGGNLWQDIRPLESERPHTTLRDQNGQSNHTGA